MRLLCFSGIVGALMRLQGEIARFFSLQEYLSDTKHETYQYQRYRPAWL
jgi:hypothetical protein